MSGASPPEAARDCGLCPRLVAYRAANAAQEPLWFNGAAPSFGDPQARFLVVGLAPGRTGANRTGRPFTGDYAGALLYGTLSKLGFGEGTYRADPGDGFILRGAMVTNAVRCAPPQNKPTPDEVARCRTFLAARIASLGRLEGILALGSIAWDSVLRAHGLAPATAKFAHGAQTTLPGGVRLVASYHCSRLNTNTGRLTAAMFEAAMRQAAGL